MSFRLKPGQELPKNLQFVHVNELFIELFKKEFLKQGKTDEDAKKEAEESLKKIAKQCGQEGGIDALYNEINAVDNSNNLNTGENIEYEINLNKDEAEKKPLKLKSADDYFAERTYCLYRAEMKYGKPAYAGNFIKFLALYISGGFVSDIGVQCPKMITLYPDILHGKVHLSQNKVHSYYAGGDYTFFYYNTPAAGANHAEQFLKNIGIQYSSIPYCITCNNDRLGQIERFMGDNLILEDKNISETLNNCTELLKQNPEKKLFQDWAYANSFNEKKMTFYKKNFVSLSNHHKLSHRDWNPGYVYNDKKFFREKWRSNNVKQQQKQIKRSNSCNLDLPTRKYVLHDTKTTQDYELYDFLDRTLKPAQPAQPREVVYDGFVDENAKRVFEEYNDRKLKKINLIIEDTKKNKSLSPTEEETLRNNLNAKEWAELENLLIEGKKDIIKKIVDELPFDKDYKNEATDSADKMSLNDLLKCNGELDKLPLNNDNKSKLKDSVDKMSLNDLLNCECYLEQIGRQYLLRKSAVESAKTENKHIIDDLPFGEDNKIKLKDSFDNMSWDNVLSYNNNLQQIKEEFNKLMTLIFANANKFYYTPKKEDYKVSINPDLTSANSDYNVSIQNNKGLGDTSKLLAGLGVSDINETKGCLSLVGLSFNMSEVNQDLLVKKMQEVTSKQPSDKKNGLSNGVYRV